MAPITPTERKPSERGAALVEFALVLPLLLVVIAGIVDFGFVFQRYEVITNAAREGARIAMLPGYESNTDVVKQRVRDYVQFGLSLSNTALDTVVPVGNITVDYHTMTVAGAGGTSYDVPVAEVSVFYNHQFMLLGPMLGLINKTWGQSITLKGNSQMRQELAAPAGS